MLATIRHALQSQLSHMFPNTPTRIHHVNEFMVISCTIIVNNTASWYSSSVRNLSMAKQGFGPKNPSDTPKSTARRKTPSRRVSPLSARCLSLVPSITAAHGNILKNNFKRLGGTLVLSLLVSEHVRPLKNASVPAVYNLWSVMAEQKRSRAAGVVLLRGLECVMRTRETRISKQVWIIVTFVFKTSWKYMKTKIWKN